QMSEKSTKGEFQCEECPKSFADSRYLRRHITRMHENAKPKEPIGKLSCGMCGKQFARLSHLTRHQVVHFNVRDWSCPFCSLSFMQKAHLVTHLGRKHRDEKVLDIHNEIERVRGRDDEVTFGPSPDPSLPSTSRSSLHRRPLSDQLHIPIIICAFCGAHFSTNNQLKRHRETNHVVRCCLRCGESVNGRATMREHVRRKHPLSLSYSSRSTIASNPFVCLHCDKEFKQRTQLDRHFLARHFTPSLCEYCREEGRTPVERRNHARDDHEESRCGYCNERFDCDDMVNDHVERTHWRRGERRRARKKRPKIDVDSEEEEEEHEESVDGEEMEVDQQLSVSLLLTLPPRANGELSEEAPISFALGARLPASIVGLYPELKGLCVILPPALTSSHSLLVCLPLPYDESIREWNGRMIEVDLRDTVVA
ncbi:hypothetical protein PFISCL1PPCAC_16287, partial [Pristionchus fissidentatus]